MQCLQVLKDTEVGIDPRIEDTMNEMKFVGGQDQVAIAFDPGVTYIEITDRRNGKRLKLYL